MTNNQNSANAAGAIVTGGPVAAPSGSDTPKTGGGSTGTAVYTVTDEHGNTRSVLPLDRV
ncbi:hypothetical protein ABT093_36875 [Kitasatospora sp. NPDC002551]|uniref:hypothetical protein n=1 Tax=Kitasatospora sp. NPDC002551 TaxID=3154539 RepID=UPI0033175558